MYNKKYKSNLKSTCCNAEITYSELSSDFSGDKIENMTYGTISCICTGCKQPCNIYLKVRNAWKINPVTKVIGDKRVKEKNKLTKKEIRKILKEEDF